MWPWPWRWRNPRAARLRFANAASAAFAYGFARLRGPTFFRVDWGSHLVPASALQALREAYAAYGAPGI